MSALLLGVLEAIAHIAAVKMNDKSKYYSPGMITALIVLLPISLYAIWYVHENNLMKPVEWLYSFLYMLGGLMLAQQLVVRTSGMKYSDFLNNVRQAFFSKQK